MPRLASRYAFISVQAVDVGVELLAAPQIESSKTDKKDSKAVAISEDDANAKCGRKPYERNEAQTSSIGELWECIASECAAFQR
eukprot:1887242-Amphidinium_carterae.1